MTPPTNDSVRFPAEVLASMYAADSGRPRLTWYDDEPGPTQGERIELSAKVLRNWVNKAANLLQDDAAAGPGSSVGIDLPPHWRSLYWALAAWSVGATVVIGAGASDADVLVTDSPERAQDHGGDAILVDLAGLSRSHPQAAAAPSAVNEARELSTHGDEFVPMDDPTDDTPAVEEDGGIRTYGQVVPAARETWGPSPRVAITTSSLAETFDLALAAWAADGSLVLSRGTANDAAARDAAEGVTNREG